MKVLLFYLHEFSYRTAQKGLDSASEMNIEKLHKNCIAAFIHIEADDEIDTAKKETKLVKFIKWAAGKNETKNIVLHSFSHLSASMGKPQFSKMFFERVQERLTNTGYETDQTPFGYFLDISMKAPGHSLARIFKEF